ncbi:hypothetical protein NDS46_27755 [Paenibacillus thiaminolyticus]|nr:hypothetical protein [Paenibacillus thiaminolyticus]WCF08011.1 hypothetical protein NDS46_27755 [Paenibacillus thiaminolyticus]
MPKKTKELSHRTLINDKETGRIAANVEEEKMAGPCGRKEMRE